MDYGQAVAHRVFRSRGSCDGAGQPWAGDLSWLERKRVGAGTNDGVAAVGERALGDGALQQCRAGAAENEERRRSENEPDAGGTGRRRR